MTGPCPHFETVVEVEPPKDVCESCVEIGGRWVHLRQCLVCGRTGCCDNSPNTHATKHAHETGHAIIRSAEPGETWAWCYPDSEVFEPTAAGGWELVED